MKKEETILMIAKSILDANNECSLTGSLMLKLRCIDLGREIHDIDILMSNHASCINIPKDINLEVMGMASDNVHLKYRYGDTDICIDILSSNEDFEEINGWRLASIKGLISAKINYCRKNDDSFNKHYDDLLKLGVNYTSLREKETSDYPF
jgi:hypothetical protein